MKKFQFYLLLLCLVLFVACEKNKDEASTDDNTTNNRYEYKTTPIAGLIEGKPFTRLSSKATLEDTTLYMEFFDSAYTDVCNEQTFFTNNILRFEIPRKTGECVIEEFTEMQLFWRVPYADYIVEGDYYIRLTGKIRIDELDTVTNLVKGTLVLESDYDTYANGTFEGIICQ